MMAPVVNDYALFANWATYGDLTAAVQGVGRTRINLVPRTRTMRWPAAANLGGSGSSGDLAALSDLPRLATADQMGDIVWEFSGTDDKQRLIRDEPRMTCVDFQALRDAAVTGVGVALMPDHTCRGELR